MSTQTKISFLFCTLTLFLCFNSFFLRNTDAQVNTEPVMVPVSDTYTFESIDVPGVDFLALTASNDFEDYAGYMKSADGEKEIAFTLVDGVFTTHDFLGSQSTYFYALGNNGQAAGHYQDSDGLFHGVILENGELREYNFPDAVQTFIYGISDETGALTGSFIDAAGVRRGFSGNTIVEVPGAVETYADFRSATGAVIGSYIDSDGIYHGYVRAPDGRFIFADVLDVSNLEYFFAHGVNDTGVAVIRAKAVGDIWRTYLGNFGQIHELRFPGSVSTEGWNINRDSSVVGHYTSADGRTHGFIARPITDTDTPVDDQPVVVPVDANYTFETIEVPGVDFLQLTASSDFEDYAGYTRSPDSEKIVGFTLIDGVFKTYAFPDSEDTRFYALGNNGNAAGHYLDSNGRSHGVVLESGELRQYDFPGAVQTQIYGISDSTGALTGNFIDNSGVRRGFSGDTIIAYPGAVETYADFVSASGTVVGSYIDSDGMYHAYGRAPDGRFGIAEFSTASDLEYLFTHGINDVGIIVVRAKAVGDIPRTYVGRFGQLYELQFPDSVSTEGYNINQDGSVVGHYTSADGRTQGFIASPAEDNPAPPEQPVVAPEDSNYTFETIDVPSVEFLALTASSDFEDYAGYTKSPDSEKIVAWTLIDGVFKTYSFPDSQDTRFYALGNNGNAAGHYMDSNGRSHGVVLENGELREYDFPDAVETEIYGISDVTGVLTGNFIDASGVHRGFSGDTIVEYPEATATYAAFVNAVGFVIGSYIDAEGIYHAYAQAPDGSFVSFDPLPGASNLEYFFVPGINDVGTGVIRAKAVGDILRTYVGSTRQGVQELQVPGSVSTEGWNINQDGSVVGHYDTADGRRYGFIARPTEVSDDEPVVAPEDSNYTFETIDVPGVEFLALTASSDFEDYAGYTKSPDSENIVAWTLIDGVFKTYSFPDSQDTRFYALGNNGNAAGHYLDSNGRSHGVVLENGELREYNFPDAVETEIYGISDATGALTGNYIDTSGVRRGFSGDIIVEFPGALETYADFVNTEGGMVGSYVDADGIYHGYVRVPDGGFVSLNLTTAGEQEYFFVHGINDARVVVARDKLVDGLPRTYVGLFPEGLQELKFPGSVSTEGWNINQDGSVVGHYDTADGRRHGFIARPIADTTTPVDEPPVTPPVFSYYTFETIDVPGIDFLALTASSDFEDYAGYTRSADGEKEVGWTLIDGVFTTYEFPGSQKTHFYALGNNGQAAGHYEDSDGLSHGVILEDGELRQYDFPGAIQTFIYGISDTSGALTGSFIDASGVRRGFSGDLIIEYPEASATYADFANAEGGVIGSFVDAQGVFYPYIRNPDGRFISLELPHAALFEYFFLPAVNDAGIVIARAKLRGDIPRTAVGTLQHGLQSLEVPGSVSTEGYNINQDGSIVGHYESADGRIHGFIARPTTKAVSDHFGNVFNVTLTKGLNMLSLPLASPNPMTAKSLAGIAGATVVIALDAENQRFVGWTPDAPNDGFAIEGGQGYIVNVPQTRSFAFVGAPWTDQTEDAAAPAAISTEMPQETWAFVVSGHLKGKPAFDGYQVIVRNLRTNKTITTSVEGDYFAAATADLTRRSVVKVGDVVEVRVLGPDGNVEAQTLHVKVTPEHLANAVLPVSLDSIGKPTQNLLLQNYPNPFNPETWIPYQLAQDSPVSVSIYDSTGKLIRTLSLGFQSAGFYNSQSRAAYWDGRNTLGEHVASGIYFYQLTTPDFRQTRRLVIVK